MLKYRFPEGFKWGTATAAYQIEGAVRQDGRGESVWDRFCQMPGHILNGDRGDVACDHYNRYKEDVALMKELGHNAYRFSVSWSRVLPSGRGEVNRKGLDFYSDLVDELLAAGIEPYVTLYHWDLPQKLQDIGGWTNRDMAGYFEEYCRIIFERLGGRVKKWITLNEPFNSSFLGYYTGRDAPGYKDLSSALEASYNLLLAHGRAVRAFRESGLDGEIGITLNLLPRHPATDSEKDRIAARYADGYANRWFMDPVFKGEFPADMLELYRSRGLTLPEMHPGELALMCRKLDFVGVNYYYIVYIRHNEENWPFYSDTAVVDRPLTDRQWAIVPEGLSEILLRLKNEYGAGKIYITESGASYNDVINMDGEIEDFNRIDYLKRHIISAHDAMEQGVDLRGYFVWSLYDNFEWSFGRYSRFGIVHNDFNTQKRTIKKSGYWFRNVTEANGL